MERYFTFKYYLEFGGLIICVVILIVLAMIVFIGSLIDAWEKKQKKKNEKYWKEHEDERS